MRFQSIIVYIVFTSRVCTRTRKKKNENYNLKNSHTKIPYNQPDQIGQCCNDVEFQSCYNVEF